MSVFRGGFFVNIRNMSIISSSEVTKFSLVGDRKKNVLSTF